MSDESMMDFEGYSGLTFSRPSNGVLLVTIDRPERLNAATPAMHREFSRVWRAIDHDTATRAVVLTGAGRAFSAGGDVGDIDAKIGSFDLIDETFTEADSLVYNMINCRKPIVAAINGVAAGGGLVMALLADISLIAEGVRFTDGHIRIGLSAGDHAALIWPLLTSIAKAKYYLMTADFISAEEADRLGLVSRCVPADNLMAEALSIAAGLAAGPQDAIMLTKRAVNNWMRSAGPIFDASMAVEMTALFGGEAREGVSALRERRRPDWASMPR